MTVLITGGAGYIGSHAAVAFAQAGHSCVVLDNLANSSEVAVERVRKITQAEIPLEKGDIRDQTFVESVLQKHDCKSVIHFAGLKAVGESNSLPLKYYDYNVAGSLSLLQAMQNCDVKKIIFSSSATVYGEPVSLPFTEDHRLAPTNPYGRSKLMVEDLLRDLAKSDPTWAVGILRYFNPVGCHSSGEIGEDPGGVPSNLMPFVAQIASGRHTHLQVFGNDYDTKDGTGVRDYIHVVDLVEGHVKAHDRLVEPGCFVVNLGTGQGYSVMDVVKAFEHASNREIPYKFVERREGDVATSYADTAEAEEILDWKSQRTLRDMCQDTWNWVCKNPNGYGS